MLRRGLEVIRAVPRRVERRLSGDLGVLAYHRVAVPRHDPWDMCVAPGRFDDQLGVLRDIGTIESLDVALDEPATSRVLRRRPVFALTFDDGYVDNLRDALPVLERHDAPATMFVPTGMLDTPSFWWDHLTTLVLDCDDPAKLWDAASRIGMHRSGPAPMGDGSLEVLEALYEHFVRLTPEGAHEAALGLASQAGEPEPTASGRPMTTDELLELASHPLITIGIHTVSHPRLTLLPLGAALAEVTRSAHRLEELLGEPARLFAYPYGVASDSVADLVRSTGVERAVTTDTRWVRLREDPMRVPRLHPHDLDAVEFRTWLAAA